MKKKNEPTTITLGPNEAAMVINENREIQIHIPKFGDDEDVPTHVVYMTALGILTKTDDEFVTKVMDKFHELTDDAE
ncbi:hypothetical protein LCGC14_1029660 [marine sediment metagenome]|uniref:Uncharacterized protein n=1 Tax=marine sediment metagenome TaxID=412755 RepID=A0A0F9MZI3_9ZZZZ